MALNFPNSPTEGMEHSEEGQSWTYTSGVWVISSGNSGEFLPISGGTVTGPLVAGDSLNVVNGFVAENVSTFQGLATFNAGVAYKSDVIINVFGDKGYRFQDGSGVEEGGLVRVGDVTGLYEGDTRKLHLTETGVTVDNDLDVSGNLVVTGTQSTGSLTITGAYKHYGTQPQHQMFASDYNSGEGWRMIAAFDGQFSWAALGADGSWQQTPYRMWRDGSLLWNESIITRTSGDARYSLASSIRFKEALGDSVMSQAGAAADILSKFTVHGWDWGGELPANDERVGTQGFGLVAEEVEKLLPSAVRYQWVQPEQTEDGPVEEPTEKQVIGLDPLALIALLIENNKELTARIEALEAKA